jgi:hypothetical protein
MLQAPDLAPPDQALLSLLQSLDALRYDFVTPTPATHARVLARPDRRIARDLRDVLGWSLPFRREHIPAQLVEQLEAAGALLRDGELWKSTIRVSRVHGLLFIHSAYPTEAGDSVFLGPDSHRFADFVSAELSGRNWVGRLIDVGGGAGVGALTAAVGRGRSQVVLTDVNPKALRFARVNAAHAGVPMDARLAEGLEGAPAGADYILANPPYMIDPSARTYRDGGAMHGASLSVDWAKAALPKLAPGGRLLLYTGSAILNGGRDQLRAAVASLAEGAGARLSYREIDPDVFGEDLEKPDYADVERIAVIGCVITMPRAASPQS